MVDKPFNQAPVEWAGDAHPFARKLTPPDAALLAASLAFILIAIVAVIADYGAPTIYTVIKGVHWQLSRYGLIVGVALLLLAIYIGILRKGDVTPWFRRGTYVIVGTMLVQAVLGMVMLVGYGVQPGAPEHLIYGAGTVLALPFFIFVETTAKKRPAMGSYIWGFTLLLGVLIRAISTGPQAL
ncbi:MAG: hypothetical protein H7Y11_02750 [Armatimonadetes bacterium]|nr:hypothetical protein [Anaerolineae bacterium]